MLPNNMAEELVYALDPRPMANEHKPGGSSEIRLKVRRAALHSI